jgi:lipoyl(octanoyl) transferase
MRPLDVHWLGSTSYPEATRLQERLVASRRAGEIPDTLLLLEHPPVITFGRGADPDHVLAEAGELSRRGIEVHDAGRGGDVTYHGPGQLVGYPIVALEGDRRDAHRYLRSIEQALIEAAAEFGVLAGRVDGLTGVWVGEEKLAAIGVRLSTGWITSHGFALNVQGDLSGFETIVPCGIRGRGVTSLAKLTGLDVSVRKAAERVAPHVARELGLTATESASDIGEAS